MQLCSKDLIFESALTHIDWKYWPPQSSQYRKIAHGFTVATIFPGAGRKKRTRSHRKFENKIVASGVVVRRTCCRLYCVIISVPSRLKRLCLNKKIPKECWYRRERQNFNPLFSQHVQFPQNSGRVWVTGARATGSVQVTNKQNHSHR